MLTKETIKALCGDENFVQDFLRFYKVKEESKRLVEAINVINLMSPSTNLDSAKDTYVSLEKSKIAHSNLLEDVYDVTWHCFEDIKKILTDKGLL